MSAAAVARSPAPRRVCLFGTYARDHTTTRLLRQGLRHAGCEVSECHAPLWENTRDKTSAYFGPLSLLRLAGSYAGAAVRLAWRRRGAAGARLYVAGFNGQLDVLLFRLLDRRSPMLFAPLVTIAETLVDDRRVYRPGSAMARLVSAVDRLALRAVDRVLIDTEAHAGYLTREMGVPASRVACWHLGADVDVFRPAPPRRGGGPLRVLFYGQFLPLHGIETIMNAIVRLSADPLFEFTVIGTGPERARAEEILARCGRRRPRWIEWVAYPELGGFVAASDVCLGSFGSSSKAQRVIPNKVYQAAAVGRAVVTADTPALREIFTPDEDVVACAPASDEALVAALLRLRDEDERCRIALAAQRLMARRFAPGPHGERLREIVEATVGR